MPKRSCLAIILAAGEGTRMRSSLSKVMHKVAGLPMIGHVLNAAKASGATDIAVVIGPKMDALAAYVAKAVPGASVHVQAERLGTGHAVLAAKAALAKGPDEVLILYGDTPLVTPETLKRVRTRLAAGADNVLVGFRPENPFGYGRMIFDGKQVVDIREEKDATDEERKLGYVWGGIMGFRGAGLLSLLKRIGNDNAQHEYYLTDAVALGNRAKRKIAAIEADADEVAGINSRLQLSHVEGLYQRRAREEAMVAGATMIAPSTVWFSYDTKLGRDVVIEPNVFFGPGVTVADNVSIRANSHIEGAKIASGAIVGPFARLRPGADIGPNAHIGNFVEVKNGVIDAGAKVNHLTYIGDAHIGAGANIGAGTITCNYDGFGKYHTEIGANAFIGSNSSLVAPVTIGEGAIVAAGSVITKDVAPNALGIARGRQADRPDWALRFRDLKRASKRPAE